MHDQLGKPWWLGGGQIASTIVSWTMSVPARGSRQCAVCCPSYHSLDNASIPIAGFTNIDFLEAVFKGYGTPYDIIRWDVNNSPDLKALLWASDGSARYSSIFMCVRPSHGTLLARLQRLFRLSHYDCLTLCTVPSKVWSMSALD
jgi:hypothetical protein